MSASKMTKELWVDMFKASGMDEEMMHTWHTEFEQRAPELHQSFLEWLNIPADEISTIRERFSSRDSRRP